MTGRSLDSCRAFVRAQLSGRTQASLPPPSVTISRAVGAGGLTIGGLVCATMMEAAPPGAAPWTVFDKNLVGEILADHDLPEQIAHFIVEEAHPAAEVFIEEALGHRPPEAELFEATSKTIGKLAQMGSCVIVGRGANLLTRHMPSVLQVRLVASAETRARRVQVTESLDHRAAVAFVRDTDRARARYIKRHFNQDITDPAMYDVVLNTETLSAEEAAAVIVAGVEALGRRAGAARG